VNSYAVEFWTSSAMRGLTRGRRFPVRWKGDDEQDDRYDHFDRDEGCDSEAQYPVNMMLPGLMRNYLGPIYVWVHSAWILEGERQRRFMIANRLSTLRVFSKVPTDRVVRGTDGGLTASSLCPTMDAQFRGCTRCTGERRKRLPPGRGR